MPNEILSKEELTKERTPPELWTWWTQKNDQIYYSGEKGRKGLRLHRGFEFAKEFTEEVFPLAKFGIQKFGDTDQILIQPVIGDQNYDAVVTELRTQPASKSYLEITQSHEGEQEYLRNFVLLKEGSVFRFGKVTKTRTRYGIQISQEPDGAEVEKAAEEDLERILDAAKKKIGKAYSANTSLLIFFDDTLHFPRVIDDARLDSFAREKILNLGFRFSSLYLVGWDHVFREYSLI